jgi:hypothetical protein
VYFKSINGPYSSFLDSHAQWPSGGEATHATVFLWIYPTHNYVSKQKFKDLCAPLPSWREVFRGFFDKLLNPQAMDISEIYD